MMVYKNLQNEISPAQAVENNIFISTLSKQVHLLLPYLNKPYMYAVASVPPHNKKENGGYW